MLNKEKHQLIMGSILRDIYINSSINSLLGFKGGTCAYFFYGLPRFSVDLDFDLFVFDKKNIEKVFKEVVDILNKYGEVKIKRIKRYTIFVLLSYGEKDYNIKIEISTRENNLKDYYETKEYLGTLIFVCRTDYMFASKLIALTSRNETATRDVYDIYFFAKNNWSIDFSIIEERTGKNAKDYLLKCIDFIEKIKGSKILHGLGELIDNPKEKDWIKNNLKKETIYLLEKYVSVLD